MSVEKTPAYNNTMKDVIKNNEREGDKCKRIIYSYY